MNYTIRITRQAREHLREIRRYIENELKAPQAALNTIDAIKAEILSLQEMPARIHLTPEEPWREQGVRREVVRNFYIYFWIDEDNRKVQVIAVVYIKRDQVKQLIQMNVSFHESGNGE